MSLAPESETEQPSRRIIEVQEAVLGKNDSLGERNRRLFQDKDIFVLNLISSPGSGKTALLERTLTDLGPDLPMGVIVGDLATDNDARRLQGRAGPVLQIVTDGICHLDAAMVADALKQFALDGLRILFIENVGNLVCPVSYFLGEEVRVVLLSVTEGEDKPLKYPTAFSRADIVVLTKIDIAEAVGFDREAALRNIRSTAPQAALFEISSRTGAGMEAWYAYLRDRVGQGCR